MKNSAKKDSCGKMVIKAVFSHVGLCSMVILYCVAGGFIFEHLEKKNEEQVCYDAYSEFYPMENKTLNSIFKIFYDYGGAVTTTETREIMGIQIQSVLDTFRDNTLAIGYDGRNCSNYGNENGPKYHWSWAGGLMFSVTVITTIGYGNIAPKTVWGRLVCIAYALLGIPLMLLCLANIGDVLANTFRFIYVKICCCGFCKWKNKNKEKTMGMKPVKDNTVVNWTSNESKTSSGDGNSQTTPKFCTLKSRPTTEISITSDGRKRVGSASSRSSKIKIIPLDVSKDNPLNVQDDSDSDDDDLDGKKVTIPLTITMIVIGGYIFGGAVLFGLWEGWDWLQSAYFCFITLSTIGFGDVVPGTDFENPQAQAQLLLGSIYVLFGMAILSMCFSLMQDEILAKAHWIGLKLGLIEKEVVD